MKIHAGFLRCAVVGVVLLAGAQQTPVSAQTENLVGGGYIVFEEINLPDQDVAVGATELYHSPNRMDVKAIGMGRTQVANGRSFNAMMDNPALLSHQRFTIDLLGFQAGIPKPTLDAASFVKDNQNEFSSGDFFTLIRDGYGAYENAATVEERLDAIALIRDGLVFPNQLLDETVGNQNDPNTHGLNVIPNIQAQWGRLGFSLYGTGQVGFVVAPGNSIDQLLSLDIPADTQELDADILRSLSGVVNSLFDAEGNLASEGLPQAFAITYFDVVGAAGYAHNVQEGLEVGANLKVIHRRFSTKNIDADNLDAIVKEARNDLDESITGLTVDLGALYQYGERGTEIGLAVQNLLPLKTIDSTTRFSFVNTAEYYLVDDNEEPLVGFADLDGNFIAHAEGDTLLFIENEQVNVQSPFELKAPLMVNAGVWHPVNSDWDVSFDWADILAQDDKFENYLGRFRLGTEYRLANNLVALRGGIADEHLTLGAGLNFKVLQLDVAYAYDNFVEENAYYLQLKLGW